MIGKAFSGKLSCMGTDLVYCMLSKYVRNTNSSDPAQTAFIGVLSHLIYTGIGQKLMAPVKAV